MILHDTIKLDRAVCHARLQARGEDAAVWKLCCQEREQLETTGGRKEKEHKKKKRLIHLSGCQNETIHWNNGFSFLQEVRIKPGKLSSVLLPQMTNF